MAARKTKSYAKTIGGSKKSRVTGFTQKSARKKEPVKSDGVLLEEKRKAQRRKAKPKKLSPAQKLEARVKGQDAAKQLDAIRKACFANTCGEIDTYKDEVVYRFAPRSLPDECCELEARASTFTALPRACFRAWKEAEKLQDA